MLGRADEDGESALRRVVDAYALSIGGYRAQVPFLAPVICLHAEGMPVRVCDGMHGRRSSAGFSVA